MGKTIIFLLLIYFIYASIFIYSPSELKKKFSVSLGEKVLIRSSYANFGRIPYGTNLIGRIDYYANNSQGCHPFIERAVNENSEYYDVLVEPEIAPIILVERGGCSFVKKTRNIQEFGGSLAMIALNDAIDNPEHLIMVDDGTGTSIQIPTILIGKIDGDILKSFLTDRNISNSLKKEARIMANFEINNPDNRVEYDIWYSPNQKSSYEVISSLHSINKALGTNVLMTPRIVLSTGIFEYSLGLLDNENCIPGTKYCAIWNSKNTNLKGKDTLIEGLRQKCIYSTSFDYQQGEKWWEYIELVHENCKNGIEEECLNYAFSHSSINKNLIQKCINESFSKDKLHNSVLEEDLVMWKNSSIAYFPAIVINNMTYRGAIEPLNILSALCAGFNETPSVCNYNLNLYEGYGERVLDKTTIFLLIILIVILNVIGFYCYRRYTKREMKEEMQLQITSLMTQYFALTEQSKLVSKENK